MAAAFNPPADGIALNGLESRLRHIERATRDGQRPRGALNLMSASMQGAMAFQKGLGCVHSLSHSLGGVDPRLHHGTLNAMFLPAVVRFNAQAPSVQKERRLDRMAHAMGWTVRRRDPGSDPRHERAPGAALGPGRAGVQPASSTTSSRARWPTTATRPIRAKSHAGGVRADAGGGPLALLRPRNQCAGRCAQPLQSASTRADRAAPASAREFVASCSLASAPRVQSRMRPGRSPVALKSVRSGSLPLGSCRTHSGSGASTIMRSRKAVARCRHSGPCRASPAPLPSGNADTAPGRGRPAVVLQVQVVVGDAAVPVAPGGAPGMSCTAFSRKGMEQLACSAWLEVLLGQRHLARRGSRRSEGKRTRPPAPARRTPRAPAMRPWPCGAACC